MISTRCRSPALRSPTIRSGVERQSVGAADIVDALGQVAGLGRILHPQRDVLGHAQRLEQREMLKHHRDARGPRGRGSGGV
jgi:hypothetical protein